MVSWRRPRRHGVGVHAQGGQDLRHGHGVGDVRLPAFPKLAPVGLLGEEVGLVNLLSVFRGEVGQVLFQVFPESLANDHYSLQCSTLGA
jgi:hypothetical protein